MSDADCFPQYEQAVGLKSPQSVLSTLGAEQYVCTIQPSANEPDALCWKSKLTSSLMFTMVPRSIALFFLLMRVMFLPAQDLHWVNAGDNFVGVEHEAVIALDQGDWLVAGKGSSGIREFSPVIDTLLPVNFSSVHLARIDSVGQYQWVSSFVDSATSQVAMAQMGPASVIVAAQVEGGIFNLGNGVLDTMPAGYGGGTLIAKYSLSTGLAQWSKIIPNSYELGGVAVGGARIYVTGSYTENFQVDGIALPDAPSTSLPFAGITNGYVAAFDSTGTMLWAEEMETLVNISQTNYAFVTPTGIASDGGNVYVAGYHKEDMQVGSQVLSQSSGAPFDSTDIFVAAYSSTGVAQWAQSSVGSSWQWAQDLSLTPEGDLLLTGSHSSDFDFAGGTIVGVGKNIPLYRGGFVVKLNNQGSYQWSTSSTGLIAAGAGDTQHGYLLGGYFNGDSGVFTLGATSLSAPAGTHLFLAKTDSLGDIQWFTRGQTGNPPYSSWQGINDLAVDNQGKVAVVGTYNQTLDWVGQSTPSNGFSRDHHAAVFEDTSWIVPGPPPFPTDSVWPGDANYDLITNNFDILAIGLAYGSTGPTRPNASLSYVGQPCYDWADTLPSGANYKHADTDGNGLVEAFDTIAVSMNYGLTHSRPADVQRTGPLLVAHFEEDSLSVNDTAHISVKLGTDTLPAEDIYGIAFTLNFDTSLVNFSSLTVSYEDSWLGANNTDLLGFHRGFASGQLDMALTRTDQVDSSGYGTLAHLTIIMVEDLTAKTELAELLSLAITNVRALDQTGMIQGIAIGRDSMVITQVIEDSVGTFLPADLAAEIRIYPQPASRRLRVELGDLTAQGWTLYDLTGRLQAGERVSFQSRDLKLPQLSDGFYLLEISTPQGLIRRRVWLQQP